MKNISRSQTTHETFIFKEAITKEELKQLFHLRYNVYRNSEMAHWAPENKSRLNIDIYDLTSRHYGLFKEEANRQIAIGNLRLAGINNQTCKEIIQDLINSDPDLERSLGKQMFRLPLCDYADYQAQIDDFLNKNDVNGKLVAEAGRFAIDPQYRSLGLANFMMKALIAVGHLVDKVADCTIITGHPQVDPIYENFGFIQMPHTDYFYANTMQNSILVGDCVKFMLLYNNEIQRYSRDYINQRCISYHARSLVNGLHAA